MFALMLFTAFIAGFLARQVFHNVGAALRLRELRAEQRFAAAVDAEIVRRKATNPWA